MTLKIISRLGGPQGQQRNLESWTLSYESRMVSGLFLGGQGGSVWHQTHLHSLFLSSKVSCKSGAILGFQLVVILDFQGEIETSLLLSFLSILFLYVLHFLLLVIRKMEGRRPRPVLCGHETLALLSYQGAVCHQTSLSLIFFKCKIENNV